MSSAFGRNLKLCRVANGMRMRDVAAACDVSVQTVVQWESGRRFPRQKNLAALCHLFDTSGKELLEGELPVSTPMRQKDLQDILVSLTRLNQEGVDYISQCVAVALRNPEFVS